MGLINLLCPCAVTASPLGSLWTSSSVILNCSFSRPDLPASVHWFRDPGRVPVQESPHHLLAGNFLFLPHVSPLDSGTWGCTLTYRDGFSVSTTYSLTVLGNSSSLRSHLTTIPSCPPFPHHLPRAYEPPNQADGTCDCSGPHCPSPFSFSLQPFSGFSLLAFPSVIQPHLPPFGLLLAHAHSGVLSTRSSSTLFCSLARFRAGPPPSSFLLPSLQT